MKKRVLLIRSLNDGLTPDTAYLKAMLHCEGIHFFSIAVALFSFCEEQPGKAWQKTP